MARLDRIIEWEELEQIVVFSTGDLEDLERLDGFPKRIELGSYRFGWWLPDLLDWLLQKDSTLIDYTQL